tara:strand:- start:47 stop:505 length:459 start_codon:yes stop_codon:yes gene_type:complete
MQKVFLSAISAIAGGTIVHLTDKEIIDKLKSDNKNLLDRNEKLKYDLIKKEKRLNECIKELEELPIQEENEVNEENEVTINVFPETINIDEDKDIWDLKEEVSIINIDEDIWDLKEEVSTININGMDQWNWMRLRLMVKNNRFEKLNQSTLQ